MSEQYEAHAFTLRGLVRRMARLADNARMAWSTQRMAALSWIAAVATKLGGECRTHSLL
jgi:U3 small nucleolar RNA-associated protein 20